MLDDCGDIRWDYCPEGAKTLEQNGHKFSFCKDEYYWEGDQWCKKQVVEQWTIIAYRPEPPLTGSQADAVELAIMEYQKFLIRELEKFLTCEHYERVRHWILVDWVSDYIDRKS